MKLPKPTQWIGSSRDDLREFPDEVRRLMAQRFSTLKTAMSTPPPRRCADLAAGAF
jgi:phage-related protein